jgi:CHAT domain-containing protein
LLDRLRDYHSEYDQLLRHIEQSSPTYYAIKYSDEVADATTVSESLSDNEALIEFYADQDSVYSIVLTSTEWHFASTAAGPVAQSVNQLVGSLTGQIFHDYVASASDLYRQLLKPAEAVLGSKDLIIVPHGILHHVPFETLLYSEPDLTADTTSLSYSSLSYLVKRHAISYSYSATLREIMRRRTSRPADRQFLGIAPVQYTSDEKSEGIFSNPVRALPGAESEVTGIHNLFSPAYRPLMRLLNNSSAVSLGKDASEAAIQKLELSRYKYIHFATHGIVNDTIPELSGLVMHPSSDGADDILHLGEIYGMELNADLVVLSACETGRGKIVVGNGVVGLTGGFLFAGARNVVVSLWQVDDVTAGELMRPFYVRFLRRNEYRRALRSSKLEMIASESKYARPYYWAPFVLFDS